eukprot:TRINITY_DN12560_c0_g1_i13.p1 TRINITY_DN12560_c0_g1~~TRINITY_DN12560_c0_g1_i13.p1  ORF type:complete len:253 (-),score=34.87 TRINITY_DN12560_c0_g1_i13:53-772(-)
MEKCGLQPDVFTFKSLMSGRAPEGVGECKQNNHQVSTHLHVDADFTTQPCHSLLHDFSRKLKHTLLERQCSSFTEAPHTLPVNQNSDWQEEACMTRRMDSGGVCTERRSPYGLAMVGFSSGHEHQSLCHKLHQNMLSDATLDHGSRAVNSEADARWEEMLSSRSQDSLPHSRDRKTANKNVPLHLQVPAEGLEEAPPGFGDQQSDDASSSRDRAHSKTKSQTADTRQEVAAQPAFEGYL